MSVSHLELKHLLLSGFLAFAITLFFIKLLCPVAHHLSLVDKPGGRKQHNGNIPLVGGVAMFLGFAFACLTLPISLAPYRSFLAGAALLTIIGVLDDCHELSAKFRLVAQIFAAILMTIWGQNILQDLGNIFYLGDTNIGLWGVPFTILAVVGGINAVNMTDGLDGLGGGLCLIEFFYMLIMALHGQYYDIAYLLVLILLVIVAFLYFNFPIAKPQAKVFMGDAGSMLLGFSLIWFVVQLSHTPSQAFSPAIILWLLAIPVFDVITVTLSRLARKQSPMQAGRDHIHHLFLYMGFSRQYTTYIILSMSLVFGFLGIVGELCHIAEGTMFFSLIGLYMVYFAAYHLIRRRHMTHDR